MIFKLIIQQNCWIVFCTTFILLRYTVTATNTLISWSKEKIIRRHYSLPLIPTCMTVECRLMYWPSYIIIVFFYVQDNYDITLNSITYCDSENYDRFIWQAITGVYLLAIVALLVFLTYQNSKIPSRFREEGEVAQRVLLLIFFTVPASIIAYFTLSQHQEKYLELVWTMVVSFVLQPSLILTILFVPKVSHSFICEFVC